MNEATRQYVSQHADDDVRQLALRGCKDPQVDLIVALQQIQGRQTARRKLPSWARTADIVYPPHLSMEQCSSEQTARYKAALCHRVCQGGGELVDLTGGFGVDLAFMSQAFSHATYVEQQAHLVEAARHNFGLLGIPATCIQGDAVSHLAGMPHATMIYLDPARRDGHGARTYGMADCTPDVLAMKQNLLLSADFVLLKLSPMLDWQKAVSDLGSAFTREIHIVSVANECKELLLLLSAEGSTPMLYCTNDDQTFSLSAAAATIPCVQYAPAQLPLLAGQYLYEPHAAIMKAGCFAELSHRYGVLPLACNSHLFVASQPVSAFPGRSFRIEGATTMNKRDLRQALAGLSHANITMRNFPLTVAQLRQRLKIAEGGDTYLFATTLSDDTHVILICRR